MSEYQNEMPYAHPDPKGRIRTTEVIEAIKSEIKKNGMKVLLDSLKIRTL